MALLDTTGFWIIVGYVSRAQLLTEGQNVKLFPSQTDMRNGRRWIRPGNEADIVRPANLVNSISAKRKEYGGTTFKWPMVNLSPKMTSYLHTAIFDSDWNAEVTVQTFNRAKGVWEAYQMIAQFPNYKDEAEAVAGGFNNFQIAFLNGALAPDGPDAVIAVQYNDVWMVGIVQPWTLTVSNNGDASTFDDLVLTYTLPADMLFVSSTYAGWTGEWSTDGITYYDFTNNPPPIPRNDVRYVRYTYASALAAGAAAPDVVINCEPDTSTTINNTFVVTMTGDIDTTNNSITVSIFALPRGFDSGFDTGFGISPSGFYIPAFSNGFGVPQSGFSSGFSFGFGI